MVPYGIVYKENPHAFGESVKVWQKKFGVLTKKNIFKMLMIMVFEIIIATAITLLTADDPFFAIITPVFGVIMAVSSYFFVVRNSVVKQTVRANFRPDDARKQIVLFEDRLEYTSPFGKGSYYYNEILCAHEKNGVLTVVVDAEALPLSVFRHGIEKGEYERLTFILRGCLGEKYEYEGGIF